MNAASLLATQDNLGNDYFPIAINSFGMRSRTAYIGRDGVNVTMSDSYIRRKGK